MTLRHEVFHLITPRRPYRLRRSELYGTGRVYDDMPGATHYLGADGRYSVQIWDDE